MSPTADLIFHNARVITMAPAGPWATMVAIKGNRITKVGSDEDIRSCQAPRTEFIDCQGKTILPGFSDAHCHPLALAAHLLSVDCGPAHARSIASIQSRIRQRADQTPRGAWIRAGGYHEFYLEGRHPDRHQLDQASPDHPVKLSHQSGHACVLNSLALRLLDITTETPEPDGALIERDLDTGEPNGLLFEMNTYVDSLIPPLSAKDMEQAIEMADREFLSHGITSVQDATWGDALRRWDLLCRFKEQGRFRPRVAMMIGIEEIAEWESAGPDASGKSAGGLRQNGVKIVIQTTTGTLSPPQDVLNRVALEAHRQGYQLALHAVEMETVEAAVTALEYVLRHEPRAGHRHRIEHCSICPPPLIQRILRIGALVVTQPPFIYYSGDRYLATVAPQEQEWLYPIGSLCTAGLRVAASSDTPVVPLNPLAGIYAAVTRRTETGQQVGIREGISVMDALRLHTLEGAFASFEEDSKGIIQEGKLADLVMLSEDPTLVAPEELRRIEVTMTVTEGQIAWQKK